MGGSQSSTGGCRCLWAYSRRDVLRARRAFDSLSKGTALNDSSDTQNGTQARPDTAGSTRSAKPGTAGSSSRSSLATEQLEDTSDEESGTVVADEEAKESRKVEKKDSENIQSSFGIPCSAVRQVAHRGRSGDVHKQDGSCCEWLACPFKAGQFATLDGFQLLVALCLFSCMRSEEKLAFVFSLFDFENRGSLNYDELYLALDCCAASAERYGGFDSPNVSELESLLDSMLEIAPQGSKVAGRLSRYGFVYSKSVRLGRFLGVFADTLRYFGAGKPSLQDDGFLLSDVDEFELDESEKAFLAGFRDCHNSMSGGNPPDYHQIGIPEEVCGCTDGFYLEDGSLVQIASSVVCIYSPELSSGKEFASKWLRWYHNRPIEQSSYCWVSGVALTACKEKVVVWKSDARFGLRPVSNILLDGRGCSALAWSSAGYVACTFSWGALVLYKINIASGTCTEVYSVHLPRRLARAVCFINDAQEIQKSNRKWPELALVVCGQGGYVEFFRPAAAKRQRGHAGKSLVSPEDFGLVELLCAAYHPDTECLVMGGSDGYLYEWEGVMLKARTQAHNRQRVEALHVCSRGFCTGGATDGEIKLWSINARHMASFDNMQRVDAVNFGIKSVCWSRDGARISVVTQSNELFTLNGINGANVSTPGEEFSALSVGHLGIQTLYLDTERGLLLTAGQDKALKLWDALTGEIVSTCKLDAPVICIRTAKGPVEPKPPGDNPLDRAVHNAVAGLGNLSQAAREKKQKRSKKSHHRARSISKKETVVSIAIGMRGGCAILERDTAAGTWLQSFSFFEQGFDPACVALSPCRRFLAAGDRIFDVKLKALHGLCPILTKSPENFFFTHSIKRGHWRLHVDEHVFDLSLKTLFHKQNVSQVPQNRLEKESKVAEAKAAKLKAKHEKQQAAMHQEEQRNDDDPESKDDVGSNIGREEIQAATLKNAGTTVGGEGEGHDISSEDTIVRPSSPTNKSTKLILTDPIRGTLMHVRNHSSFSLTLNTENAPAMRSTSYRIWQDSQVESIQGFKGRWNDSVVSDPATGFLAYAAFDCVVLVSPWSTYSSTTDETDEEESELAAKEREEQVKQDKPVCLHMFSQVVSLHAQATLIPFTPNGLDGECGVNENNDSVAGSGIDSSILTDGAKGSSILTSSMSSSSSSSKAAGLRIIVSDGDSVALWDVEGDRPKLRFRLELPGGVFVDQVVLDSSANYAALVTGNGIVHILDCKSRAILSSSPLSLDPAKVTRKPHIPCRERNVCFLDQGSSGDCDICIAEIVCGLPAWAVHRFSGRTTRSSILNHDCGITVLDEGWIGDDSGSLWRITCLEEDSFRLSPIARNAHDGGPVVALRNGVSASRAGVVREWDPNSGRPVRTILCAKTFAPPMTSPVGGEDAPSVDVWAVSSFGAILDGHRVVNFRDAEDPLVVTSAHSKVRGVTFTYDKSDSVAKGMFLTIGEKDASVCLWTRDLRLKAQTLLVSAPKDAVCTCAQFSYSGAWVAVGTSAGTVHVLKVPTLKQLITLTCGQNGSGIQCVAFAPDPAPAAGKASDQNRLAVVREDGGLYFFTSRLKLVKKPLLDLEKLTSPPVELAFATDCEIVMCKDASGNVVYADSVSANHIPEEHMERKWVSPPSTVTVQIDHSVLKHRAGANHPEYTRARKQQKQQQLQQQEQQLQSEPEKAMMGKTSASPKEEVYEPTLLKEMRVFGASKSTPRNFNSAGELMYVAANTVVSHEVDLVKQRVLHNAPASVRLVAYDQTEDGRRDIVALCTEDQVTVFNAATSAIIGRWDLTPCKDRLGSTRTGKVESVQPQEKVEDDESDAGAMVAKRLAVTSWLDSFGRTQVKVAVLFGNEVESKTLALCSTLSPVVLYHELLEPYFELLFLVHHGEMVVALIGEESAHLFSSQDDSLSLIDKVHELTGVRVCSSPGVFGMDSGKILFFKQDEATIGHTTLAHESAVQAIGLGHRFQLTGEFASTDETGDLKLWRSRVMCTMVLQLNCPSTTLSLHPSGMIVAADSHQVLVDCYFEKTGGVLELPFNGHGRQCTASAWVRDGGSDFLFTGSKDCTLCKWDVRAVKRVDTIPVEDVPIAIAYCTGKLFVILETQPQRKLVVLDMVYYDIMHESKLPADSVCELRAVDPNGLELTLVDPKNSKAYTMSCETYKFSSAFPRQNSAKDGTYDISLRDNCAFLGTA